MWLLSSPWDAGKSRVGACHVPSLSAHTGGGCGAVRVCVRAPLPRDVESLRLDKASEIIESKMWTHSRGARSAGRELCFPQPNPPPSNPVFARGRFGAVCANR